MDGAFFRQDVLELLEARDATYAIKVPFYTWVGLKGLVQKRHRWRRLDGTISYFVQTLSLEPWDKTLRVVIYRPADGHFEYSVVATNTELSGKHLWWFFRPRKP